MNPLKLPLLLSAVSLMLMCSIWIAGSAQADPSKPAEPKTFGYFKTLNPGSIRAGGWIKGYAKIIADGWPMIFVKEDTDAVYGTYWHRDCGHVDYPGYFGDGFIRLSHTAPTSNLAMELDPWMKKLMATQDPDGYIGPLGPATRWQHPHGVLSQGLMLQGLIYHYKVTGDRSILEACIKCADGIVQAYHQDASKVNPNIFATHGTYVSRPLRELYLLTGNTAYRDALVDMIRRYMLVKDPKGWHNVEQCEHVGLPAIAYEVSGDESLLKVNLQLWDTMQQYIMIDGQPTGNEGITPRKPRAIGEHCGSVEWIISNEDLLRVTGDVKFADAIERAFFNAYPTAKSADTLSLGYVHSANQLAANEWSHPHWDDWDSFSREYYSTAHAPLCCNVMSPRCLPYFVDNMVMRTDKGLAVVHYGPSRAKTDLPGVGVVEITQETVYPFEDEVKITVSPQKDAEFPVDFRIPGWCSSAALELNGKPLDVVTQPGKYATVQRTWRPGDTVKVRMQVPIRLDLHEESMVRTGGAAVMRGPLTFTLAVPEEWMEFECMINGPSKKPISYRLRPKDGAVWNYAMIVDKDNPEKSFKLKKLAEVGNGNPWKSPVLGLEVNARQVLGWEKEFSRDFPMTPGLPLKFLKMSNKVTKITLVPIGTAHLRMSYLPYVNE